LTAAIGCDRTGVMRKIHLIALSLLIAVSLGCKSLNDDVIPKTSLDSSVVAPARVLTHAATMRVVAAMLESGAITDPKSLKEAIKQLRKIKIPGSRQKIVTTIGYASPKNTSADTINVTYNPTNAVFMLYMTNLTTTTDPSVVIAAGEAQATVTGAEGEAFRQAMDGAAGLTDSLGKLTPSGQVKSVLTPTTPTP
jgi:hypothetical protein